MSLVRKEHHLVSGGHKVGVKAGRTRVRKLPKVRTPRSNPKAEDEENTDGEEMNM